MKKAALFALIVILTLFSVAVSVMWNSPDPAIERPRFRPTGDLKVGLPIKRGTVDGVSCTIFFDSDGTVRFVVKSHDEDFTNKKVEDCVARAKKGGYTLAARHEIEFGAALSGKVDDVDCFIRDEYVLVFRDKAPKDLSEKSKNCFAWARKIWKFKMESPSWV